jgi:hypothetical protein
MLKLDSYNKRNFPNGIILKFITHGSQAERLRATSVPQGGAPVPLLFRICRWVIVRGGVWVSGSSRFPNK